ncbi:MAG: hypothetical protein REH83_05165 [Rickettsiella sp.]|nr:hypothetical protein [Rickettsiella sp.]
MQSFTGEQEKYLADFKYQLEQIKSLFNRLSPFQDNTEMRKVANALSRRKTLIEVKIKFIKENEFSGFLADACNEINNAIESLKNYYEVKIKKLHAIYSMYEKETLNSNVHTLLKYVVKVKTSLEEFIKHNYFIEALQYEPELKSRLEVLTKTLLTKVSACAEILELELLQSKEPKPRNADIQKVFENFNICINGLEAKCKNTIESLKQQTDNLLNYKEVFALAENKSVQTIISGEIHSANIISAVRDTAQEKPKFLGKFFKFFRASVPDAVQINAEEAKERELDLQLRN